MSTAVFSTERPGARHEHGCHGHACVAMPFGQKGELHAHTKRGRGTRTRTRRSSAAGWLAGSVFSFEAVFVLFLMAGRYKADPRLEWLQTGFSLDLTALLLAASMAAGLTVVLRRGYRLPPSAATVLACGAAWFGYAALAVLWSPTSSYAQAKALHVGVLTSWTFVAGSAILASSRYRARRFFAWLVLFSVWLSLESLWSSQAAEANRSVSAMGGTYLGLGRMIGAAATIALAHGLFATRSPAGRLASAGLFVAFCLVLLILGGRMPLAATVAAAIVPVAVMLLGHARQASGRALWVYGLLLAVALLGAWHVATAPQAPRTIERMRVLLYDELGSSAHSRLDAYEAAVGYWWERPLWGHGLGAWPILHLQADQRAYPHNLLLETLVELGLCGAILLGLLAAVAWRRLGGLAGPGRDPLRMTVLMLAVNALGNALVSGDIPDNRFLFAVVGLACLPPRQRVVVRAAREHEPVGDPVGGDSCRRLQSGHERQIGNGSCLPQRESLFGAANRVC